MCSAGVLFRSSCTYSTVRKDKKITRRFEIKIYARPDGFQHILPKKLNRNSTTYVSLISVSVNKHIVSNFRLPDNLEIFNAKNLKMQIPTPLEFSLYVLTEAEKVGGENLNPHWSSFSVLNFRSCPI